jgi:hypothetical protein
LVTDSHPFVAASAVAYRPKMNCGIVIMPRHETIIRFFPVMAYILDHALISTEQSLLKKTDLSVSTTCTRNTMTAVVRAPKNAVLSHLRQGCMKLGGPSG